MSLAFELHVRSHQSLGILLYSGVQLDSMHKVVMSILSRFSADRSGSVMFLAALTLPVLLAVAGVAVDYSLASNSRAELQHIADSAALAGARTYIKNSGKSDGDREKLVIESADMFVASQLKNRKIKYKFLQKEIALDKKQGYISVILKSYTNMHFGKFLGLDKIDISANAVAEAIVENSPICILALDPNAMPGILFQGSGDIVAKNCVVWSNSDRAQSMKFQGSGKAEAGRFCAAGSVDQSGRYTVKPEPESDCEYINDPMASWEPPLVGPCTEVGGHWKKSKTTIWIDPGVYCGGLRVEASNINMKPGIYFMQDGPLILRGNSKVVGKDVGIYLSGDNTTVDIAGDVKVEIKAAVQGEMAGVIIAQDPESSAGRTSSITGNSDLKVGGIVYLPTQHLSYWGNSKTQAASPVTTIVAQTVEIGGDAYLEVTNEAKKAKYAPEVSSGQSRVRLIQ